MDPIKLTEADRVIDPRAILEKAAPDCILPLVALPREETRGLARRVIVAEGALAEIVATIEGREEMAIVTLGEVLWMARKALGRE